VSQEKSSVLITGGCGFIGSNLIEKLGDLDYQVTVLDNLSVGQVALKPRLSTLLAR
jgi:UDP-glucose 4-epimerase